MSQTLSIQALPPKPSLTLKTLPINFEEQSRNMPDSASTAGLQEASRCGNGANQKGTVLTIHLFLLQQVWRFHILQVKTSLFRHRVRGTKVFRKVSIPSLNYNLDAEAICKSQCHNYENSNMTLTLHKYTCPRSVKQASCKTVSDFRTLSPDTVQP